MNELLKTLYIPLLIAEFALGSLVFVALFFVTAPYGRHSQKGWGPVLQARVAWMVMELPAVLVIALFFFFAPGRPGRP
jgi:3-oxo-5-alpha-steroid 4-dehydrogenase 1